MTISRLLGTTAEDAEGVAHKRGSGGESWFCGAARSADNLTILERLSKRQLPHSGLAG